MFLNIDKHFLALISVVLCVMITIVAFLFFLSGVWIILFIDILYLANLLVINDRTPGLSLTSNLRYRELIYFLLLNGFTFFQGSTKNVLDRFYQSSKKYDSDYIVRVTSDCPLIDAELIDQVID